nr:zinc ribbon domain-containing protein [Candidatus Njordarchaeum guaymaensis]
MLNVFFALYVFKVGRAYQFASLKTTALALLGVPFAELTPAILIKPYPPWVLYSGFGPFVSPEVIEVVSLFSWLLLGFSFALVLLFIWGATDMENETGLKTFGTARTLMVAGIFILFLFPIGLFKFGSGLKQLAVLRDGVICSVCGKSVDPRAVFCKFCGARIKKEKD